MMTKNHNHLHMVKCLKIRRSEILEKWLGRIDADEKLFLIQTTGGLYIILNKYFIEVMNALSGEKSTPRAASFISVPLYAVPYKISLILLGREIFVEMLKQHLLVSEELRPSMLKKVQEAFHEVLRHHSATACNNCRWALNKKLQNLTETKSSLEQVVWNCSIEKQAV